MPEYLTVTTIEAVLNRDFPLKRGYRYSVDRNTLGYIRVTIRKGFLRYVYGSFMLPDEADSIITIQSVISKFVEKEGILRD